MEVNSEAPDLAAAESCPASAHTPELVPSSPSEASLTEHCLCGNKIMLRGEMRSLIGFKKPQEPVELQMAAGPGGWNQPPFYGGERGLRGLGAEFTGTVSDLISQPSGFLLPH